MNTFQIISILLIFIQNILSCEILNDDKNTLKLQIIGDGFHRTVSLKAHLKAKTRFTQCRLLYRFNIPKTMFIDDNALNRSLHNYELITFRPFDTEATAKNAKPQRVYFLRKKLFLSTFEIKDHLTFPIHMRYTPAGGENALHRTTFLYPEVAVDCENNSFAKCPKFAVHPDERLKSNSANWIAIDQPSKSTTIHFHNDSTSIKDTEFQVYFITLIGTILAGLCLSLWKMSPKTKIE